MRSLGGGQLANVKYTLCTLCFNNFLVYVVPSVDCRVEGTVEIKVKQGCLDGFILVC